MSVKWVSFTCHKGTWLAACTLYIVRCKLVTFILKHIYIFVHLIFLNSFKIVTSYCQLYFIHTCKIMIC